jgi:hypothetical protein
LPHLERLLGEDEYTRVVVVHIVLSWFRRVGGWLCLPGSPLWRQRTEPQLRAHNESGAR